MENSATENQCKNEAELIGKVKALSPNVERVIRQANMETPVKVACEGGVAGMFGEFDDDGVWNGDFADRSKP